MNEALKRYNETDRRGYLVQDLSGEYWCDERAVHFGFGPQFKRLGRDRTPMLRGYAEAVAEHVNGIGQGPAEIIVVDGVTLRGEHDEENTRKRRAKPLTEWGDDDFVAEYFENKRDLAWLKSQLRDADRDLARREENDARWRDMDRDAP